ECQACGAAVDRYDDGVACADCWAAPRVTALFGGPLCAKCGLPLQAGLADEKASRCGRCDALPFTARACGAYAGALEASVRFLKSHPHLCRRLRRLIAHTFAEQRAALAADVIVPVPLHRQRRRERGFNQAELIARVVARESRLPVDARLLVRTKPTERHRAGLDAKDRARSVARAFRVPRMQAVAGLSVLLVDDVFTTGSTLSAAAQSLLKAGADRVSVLTIARVVAPAAGRRGP
ncbi:MAG TPA: ComF family protein, partial [Blastocatellia bacterium]|nr:ComF family protein [Blastocatellia bacterium]